MNTNTNTNSNADATNTTQPLPLLVSSNEEARIASSFSAASSQSSNIAITTSSSSTLPSRLADTDVISLNQHMLSNTNTIDNTAIPQVEQRMKKVEEKCEVLLMQNMALTQRLELMEMQLEGSKALNMQLKQAIHVARTDEKDKADIVKMRLDSLERRTYYMERYFLSGATTM